MYGTGDLNGDDLGLDDRSIHILTSLIKWRILSVFIEKPSKI